MIFSPLSGVADGDQIFSHPLLGRWAVDVFFAPPLGRQTGDDFFSSPSGAADRVWIFSSPSGQTFSIPVWKKKPLPQVTLPPRDIYIYTHINESHFARGALLGPLPRNEVSYPFLFEDQQRRLQLLQATKYVRFRNCDPFSGNCGGAVCILSCKWKKSRIAAGMERLGV